MLVALACAGAAIVAISHAKAFEDESASEFWAREHNQSVKMNFGEFRGSSGNRATVQASWYGGGEKLARHTANGEVFRPAGLTAAHRTLPFGTLVNVTNPRTGLSVVVRVNDRGPARQTGRSLDLSRGAARAIGFGGSGPVHMQIVGRS